MNGMSSIDDLVFLQVRGKSQLELEIEVAKKLPTKYLYENAIHFNE